MASKPPRRDLWRGYEGEALRNVVADSFDDNDRDHNRVYEEMKGIRTLLIGILVSTTAGSISLAVAVAVKAI